MNILICSQHGEPQVEEVCQRLKKLGANPVIFERYRKDQFICYQYKSSVSGLIRIDDKEYQLNSETFPVVWYRPKPIILGEVPGEIAKIKEKFCFQEWRVILQSLDMFLSSSKWINAIQSSYKASNKAYQLKIANEMGLIIPTTMITNDAYKTLELFQQNRVVYKTLSSFFTAQQTIYTNEVEYEKIEQSQQEIAMAPGIFQKYIDKDHELRITVIGEKIFVTKINSHMLGENTIDWRKSHHSGLYERGTLSNKTRDKLLCFHKKLNLIYAAYDFIVNNKGEEIFIECNPSGQWLWLETMLNLDISQIMANELISY